MLVFSKRTCNYAHSLTLRIRGSPRGAAPKIRMASSVSLLVILSVSCVVIGGISKRADTKDDVCSENSSGMSFLQTEGLLNLHQKS